MLLRQPKRVEESGTVGKYVEKVEKEIAQKVAEVAQEPVKEVTKATGRKRKKKGEVVATVEDVADETSQAKVEAIAAVLEATSEGTHGTIAVVLDEELYWAEVRLAGSMAEVERRRVELEEDIESAKGRVGQAQAELNRHEAELGNLREEHTSETNSLLGLARKLMKVSAGKHFPKDEDGKQDPAATEGWRNKPTAELLNGVKGLSKKKMDGLVAHAATAGHLEDLRKLASQQCKSFCKVLPKGIGEGVAQSIEDRLVNHISDWAKKASDPDRSKLAEELVTKLRKSAEEWTEEDCRPKESDDSHLHAGFSAFREGLPYTDFLSEDMAKAHAWMSGWVGAEKLKVLKGTK